MSLSAMTSLEEFLPLPCDEEQYSYDFIESHGAIKLRETNKELIIGVVAQASEVVFDELKKFHRSKAVVFKTIDRVELTGYLGTRDSENIVRPKDDDNIEQGRILIDRLANDAPVINLVNSICIDGIRMGASDIHIEAQAEIVRIRYRVDGVLKTARRIDKHKFQEISSRIKIMSNLNIMERRLPQDGRLSVNIGDDSVDLRVSIVPVSGGESIVLRLFNKASAQLTIDQLGFEVEQFRMLKRMMNVPSGLVLITGPTGSGKTTTLNAMLRIISSDALKVITIEDPIEYLLDGVNQIQTNDQIKLTFDSILRRVLRQDPNVIMVGEIRDSATAELAVRAAMTGHLVLSTLHTNSSVSVIPRLRNLGIESYLIASVLQGAVAQRLVRKLCPSCSIQRDPSPEESLLLKRYGFHNGKVWDAVGCDLCKHSGFRGRMIISEAFVMDTVLEELIMREERVSGLLSHLNQAGMHFMAYDGIHKALQGMTTLSEIEREISL